MNKTAGSSIHSGCCSPFFCIRYLTYTKKCLFRTRNEANPLDFRFRKALGGDQQIGAMLAEGKIDMLIFFCDNLAVQGHQNDVSALSRLASLYNIAFATNRTTADMLLTSTLLGDESYTRIDPECIQHYANRKL